MTKVFNIQPIEKAVAADPNGGLDVHSIFPTIQGEGPWVGQPAVFVRLAGCNLQCPLCDTDYTTGRTKLSIHGVLDYIFDVMTSPDFSPLIVITGGEPFRQDIGPLVTLLLSKGFRVQIETNGSLYRDLPFGTPGLSIVCSPKSGTLNRDLARHIGYYKYVIKAGDVDPTDGLPVHALDHPVGRRVARPFPGILKQNIYVQPVDTQDEAENQIHLKAAIQSALRYGYTLCIQTHKIINLP